MVCEEFAFYFMLFDQVLYKIIRNPHTELIMSAPFAHIRSSKSCRQREETRPFTFLNILVTSFLFVEKKSLLNISYV